MSSSPYDDIINLPHHVSTTRPQMSSINRAAQFSPFAALSGFDAAIAETGRLTDERIELDENAVDDLNTKLSILADVITDNPRVSITYFQADDKKSGGAYVTVAGALKKIDDYERVIVLMNGAKVKIEDILDIESKLFKNLI